MLRFDAVQSFIWKIIFIGSVICFTFVGLGSVGAQDLRVYRGCTLFETELDRFSASEAWEKKLREMLSDNPDQFWSFVTGQTAVPKTILNEVNRQRDCLIRGILIQPEIAPDILKHLDVDATAIRNARWRAKMGRLSSRIRRTIQRSHYRSAKTQAMIWKKRIRRRGEEKTLRTSSAPGTSRHHWGTDIDVFATNSRSFRRNGPYHAAYLWMTKNARRFGFYQCFQGDGARGMAYIEERWHWSYGPIAEPLLKIIGENILVYERHLHRVWRHYEKVWNKKKRVKQPYFNHSEKVWRHFVFNVSEGGFLLNAPSQETFAPQAP